MPAMRLVHNAESVVFPGTPGFDIAGQSVAPLCQSELLGRIVPVEGEEVSIFRCKGGRVRIRTLAVNEIIRVYTISAFGF